MQYTYAYDGHHNAPEKDRDEKIPGPPVRVTKVIVSADPRSVRLHIGGCLTGHVIMVRALDVKSAAGQQLRRDTFHRTLNLDPSTVNPERVGDRVSSRTQNIPVKAHSNSECFAELG